VSGSRTGVWLVGIRGSVGTTAVAGAAAVKGRHAAPSGLVSELPGFPSAGLPPLDTLVFGGHDVVDNPLPKRAEQLASGGVLPARLLPLVHEDLVAADAEARPGTTVPPDVPVGREEIDRLALDLRSFRKRRRLDRVVVVNVASTEPPHSPRPEHDDLAALERALDRGEAVLPPSSRYAYAALLAGCSFVDFTPSTGVRLPALHELALREGVPYAGSDGKTGETLVKSVLAPMFAMRALRVLSWSGTNLLGGGDGANLADPVVATSKTRSKQRVLAETLGHEVDGQVHIDYVPDLGEWKTAWDHITFEGFLGVRMTAQFIWQGCDSALAAPLVLDLARLVARAHQCGRRGPLPELGFFFKDPIGLGEHDLAAQYTLLRRWAAELGEDA